MNQIPGTTKYPCVMVVDDTYIDRYIAEYGLKKFAIAKEVISKESAVDALTYLKINADHDENLPQIILLDIRMPVMDGFDFLEAFENLPTAVHEKCKIIMVSSSVDPKDHEKIKNNRFVSRFIGKPFIINNTEVI
ncbi:MAG: response regulator [Chitinophagaceae bacterium]